MKSNWNTCKLGDICSFKAGNAFPKNKQGLTQGDIPFIKVSDMNKPENKLCIYSANNWINKNTAEELKVNIIKKGCIVFAKIGEALKAERLRLTTRDTIIDNNMMAAIPNEGIAPRFLSYVLEELHLANYAEGTALPFLKQKVLEEIDIKIPSAKDQETITKILKAIENKIEINYKINRNLEEQVKNIFRAWFVEFRQHGGKKPTNWNSGTIKDLAKEVICGKTPSTKVNDNYGEDIPFVTIPDMHGNVFVVKTDRCLSLKGASTQSKKTLPPNSICVSCIGTAGLVALVSVPSQTNQQINSIIPKHSYYSYYIYLLMQTLSETINRLGAGGSTIVNLNKNQFEQIKVTIPDEDSIRMFHDTVFPYFDLIKTRQYENIKLNYIRDSLLPMLMSGKIDVSKLDIY